MKKINVKYSIKTILNKDYVIEIDNEMDKIKYDNYDFTSIITLPDGTKLNPKLIYSIKQIN